LNYTPRFDNRRAAAQPFEYFRAVVNGDQREAERYMPFQMRSDEFIHGGTVEGRKWLVE